jgi:hypothetical protein
MCEPTAPVTPAVPVIQPTAVYTLESARAALDLAEHTLGRAVRRGQLRASRRGGPYLILGSWLLAWIESGTATKRRRRASRPAANGKASS